MIRIAICFAGQDVSTTSVQNAAHPRAAHVCSAIGWALAAVALVVLFGWAFQSRTLVSAPPQLATMKANTAAAFLLAGVALLRQQHRDTLLYSLGVLLIGTLTLTEYAGASNFVDQLLFRDPFSTAFPGRMSEITAVGLVLLAPALILMNAESPARRKLSRILALIVGGVGVVAVLGYSYDTNELYQVHPHQSVALHTAIAFVIAAIGVYFANPAEGILRYVRSETAARVIVLRLLPTALFIPFLLGFAVWIAHKRLAWDMGFSLAVLVASMMMCLVAVVLVLAKRINREDLALRESEQRFRLVANTAPVMIWMSGPDKLCDYFNNPWLEFTGRRLDEEIGNGWTEGVHPDDLKRCTETYVQAFDRREPFRMEYRLRRHDEEYRWILDIGVPRFNNDCSFAGYIGSCIDVTERKLAEEALADVGRKLIQAQEEERAWIARELHDDISQRIAVVIIDLQRHEQQLTGSAEDVKSRVAQALRRLFDLGTSVRSISHRLHSSDLEYLGLGSAAATLCKEISEQRDVEVDFTDLARTKDVSREIALCLFRVLQEALNNAIKHSGVRHFTVRLSGGPEEIRLTVSDLGNGFDQQDELKHRGLGLISMRERLQLVKGQLSVTSAPGKGTTVTACVPLSTDRHRAPFSRTA